jgi:hypothetical protein
MMNLDTLAEAYLRNHEEDFWAWEEVHRAVETDLSAGWKIILLLLERAASDRDVQYVAAGPLEDLIDRYGHKALDLAEEECKNNSQLRVALGTVGVLFYYVEFERWYGLLYKYGLRTDQVADSAIIGNVMGIMKSYLSESINVCDYAARIDEVLDKPFEDKTAQRILQGARYDVEVLDSNRPPDYRKPFVTKSEMKMRVKQAVAELEHLGYQASSGN